MPPGRADAPVGRPWWREPWMWLVVGGPALVVVAAIVTAVIAHRGADTLMSVDPAAAAASRRDGDASRAPAVQGRNRAAEAGVDAAAEAAALRQGASAGPQETKP